MVGCHEDLGLCCDINYLVIFIVVVFVVIVDLALPGVGSLRRRRRSLALAEDQRVPVDRQRLPVLAVAGRWKML